jgi:hypothetical protein
MGRANPIEKGEIINGWRILSTWLKTYEAGHTARFCLAICPKCKQSVERATSSLKGRQCAVCYVKTKQKKARVEDPASTRKEVKRVARELREEEPQEEEEILLSKPKKRSDCASVPRPCPFISCKYHLYLDVTEIGTIRFNYPDTEIEDLRVSCTLDVVESGEKVLEAVGEIFGITRERIRQIESKALDRLRRKIEYSPVKQDLLLYLADSGRHEEQRSKDLILHDPNPKYLTWDEWHLRFVPKEPKEITIHEYTQMLRGKLRQGSQERYVDVPRRLATGEQSDTGRSLRGMGTLPENPGRRSDPSLPNDNRQSEGGSSHQKAELLLNAEPQRDHSGDLGELPSLQIDSLQPVALSPVPQIESTPEPTEPHQEDKQLSSDVPPIEMDGAVRAGRTTIPRKPRARIRKTYSLDSPRPKKQPPTQLKSDLGRIAYSLRKHNEGQLLTFAAELLDSPYQSEIQDSVRKYLKNSLYLGRNQDAQRAQQFLAVLLGKEPKRKDAPMQQVQAQKLLDLLAARPDKADLIEALAKEAGLLPSSSAALVFDRDVKPEKSESSAEGIKEVGRAKVDDYRVLTTKEKNKVGTLIDSGWSQNQIKKEIGCSNATFSNVLNKNGRMKITMIEKLLQLLPKQAQAAE